MDKQKEAKEKKEKELRRLSQYNILPRGIQRAGSQVGIYSVDALKALENLALQNKLSK